MTVYIIKSSISLLLMFGLYWFLLRKEKLFVFNRFFLIISIVISLIIPFVAIPVNIQSNDVQNNIVTVLNSNISVNSIDRNVFPNITNSAYVEDDTTEEKISSSITLFNILSILYFSVVILLLFRFFKNIIFITHKLSLSEKRIYSGYKIALLDHQVNPFCFFNTIFINKLDYLDNKIAKELLDHEIEHLRQSHSLDIIFIEIIQIIYWFNPILILYNRALRVNHEYLADNGVVQYSSDINSYAENLISFIGYKRNFPLTSGFNQSLTRKRLIMLTKANPNKIINSFRIFITINLAVLSFLFLSCIPSKSQGLQKVMDSSGLTNFQSPTVKDIDGNVYKTVKIGMQIWMAENLKTTKYNDGSDIPLVIDENKWQEFTPAYCWYNNNETANKDNYGALYNWYAVNTNMLCPTGWHIPTREELLNQLFIYLSNNGYGKKNSNVVAKSLASTNGWNPDSIDGNVGFDQTRNNSSGFNGLPVGYRYINGEFDVIGRAGQWWSSSGYNTYMATGLVIYANNSSAFPSTNSKRDGLSVRCLKDYTEDDIQKLNKQRDSILKSSTAADFSGVWHLKQDQIYEEVIPSILTITQQSNSITLTGTFDFLEKKPIDETVTYSLDGKETITKSGNTTRKVTAEWGQNKQYIIITTVKLTLKDGSIEETKCVDTYSINNVSNNSMMIYFADNTNPQWITYERK
ncbi:MAG: hypothetical protein IPJ16_13840 [Bacteroidales bacterium]|nr:hypothetical protein [Bacteroidales bacterium]